VVAAASLLAVAIRIFLLVDARCPGFIDLSPDDSAATTDYFHQTRSIISEEDIMDEEVDSTRFIKAKGRLTLSHVRFRSRAKVTIRAGEMVAFGNGYWVEPHTLVTVGVGTVNATRKTDLARITGEMGDRLVSKSVFGEVGVLLT
jgi:hypothetical protein